MSMNLESRRVRESRETAEEFKDLNSVKDLKKSIESYSAFPCPKG